VPIRIHDDDRAPSARPGKPVTLPTITSADPPQQAVDKLSKALGVSLPGNFGQITLVRSSDLATVQKGVKAERPG
jgi:hypothetical protein